MVSPSQADGPERARGAGRRIPRADRAPDKRCTRAPHLEPGRTRARAPPCATHTRTGGSESVSPTVRKTVLIQVQLPNSVIELV